MPLSLKRRQLLLGSAALAASALLAGCGFRLRGPQPLAFATLHIGISEYAELGAILRRQVATSGTTTVVEDAAQAEARLQILSNQREREILSLTGSGKVREYQLTQRIRFRLIDRNGQEMIPPTNLLARREYTFNDEAVLGKSEEESLLFRDMQSDLVSQIMRRLAAYRRPS